MSCYLVPCNPIGEFSVVSAVVNKLVIQYKHKAGGLQAICLVFVLYFHEKGHRINHPKIPL